MKKHTFTLLCLATVLIILSGAVINRTVLKDLRTVPSWTCTAVYTVQVTDVDAEAADMIGSKQSLYTENGDMLGTVVRVEQTPAASGRQDLSDLKLYVEATLERLSNTQPGACSFDEPMEMTFVSRFVTFTGLITGIAEEDETADERAEQAA